MRFLQVTVQIMTRDPATVEMLKANDPVVRNDLLLLFGNQKYDVVSQPRRQGEAAALTRSPRFATSSRAHGGKPEKVEQVYFTSFVMQ